MVLSYTALASPAPILVVLLPPSPMNASDNTAETKRRRELAQFLRGRRDQVQPGLHGIALRARRRASGLLREEVADIAGISLSWYTWLEQARPVNPSAQVLEGLVSALHLSATERRHLYKLARPDLNPRTKVLPSTPMSKPLAAVLSGLAPHPVYAINGRWEFVAWNRPAERLFGGFDHLALAERNVMHRLLFDPHWRTLFVNWSEIVESAIAQFRATTVGMSGDNRLSQLIDSFNASPTFANLWARQQVAKAQAKQKILEHPTLGRLTFDYATFRPDDAGADIRFTIYTPADSACAQAMLRLCDVAVVS